MNGTLILSRRVGETIVIDGNIEVTVGDINGKQVRVIIRAPKDIPVHRKEIQAKINTGKEMGNG